LTATFVLGGSGPHPSTERVIHHRPLPTDDWQEALMHPPQIDSSSARVLLVDDDPETLVLLRAALEDEGIHVVGTGGDGSEVQALVERTDPDVVLMDLRMPKMDGFDATRLLRATHPWVQVVFLTFYEEMLPEQSPQEVGAFAYLVKGCSTRLMCDVIAQARRHGVEQRWAGISGA
jgi:CheY-like chemotaxis protein